ncbi:CAPA peptides [Orussus abietinus]|uniref:CAPA peptides n=1 Tax=Orussus abietinus TaxID=222816 RepID=UPI000625C4E4|nr:CAPA peptides [Orussus abietinus]
MTDPLFVLAAFFILATSLNSGGTIKLAEIRRAGLVAYPRTGRAPKMSSYTRMDRIAALGNPRVGRSGSGPANAEITNNHDSDSDIDANFDIDRDFDPDVILNLDYPGPIAIRGGGEPGKRRLQNAETLFEAWDESRRQGLIPIPRVGRSRNGISSTVIDGQSRGKFWPGQRHRRDTEEHPLGVPWVAFVSEREFEQPR